MAVRLRRRDMIPKCSCAMAGSPRLLSLEAHNGRFMKHPKKRRLADERAQNAHLMFIQSKIHKTPSQLYNALKLECLSPYISLMIPHPCRNSRYPFVLLEPVLTELLYPWLYSGRRSFRTGEMSGCSCARNVMAHMIYIAAAERTRVDLQTLVMCC